MPCAKQIRCFLLKSIAGIRGACQWYVTLQCGSQVIDRRTVREPNKTTDSKKSNEMTKRKRTWNQLMRGATGKEKNKQQYIQLHRSTICDRWFVRFSGFSWYFPLDNWKLNENKQVTGAVSFTSNADEWNVRHYLFAIICTTVNPYGPAPNLIWLRMKLM